MSCNSKIGKVVILLALFVGFAQACPNKLLNNTNTLHLNEYAVDNSISRFKEKLANVGGIYLNSIVSTVAMAQGPTTEERIAAINNRYKNEFDNIEAEAAQLSSESPDPSKIEAAVNVEFDCTFETTSFSFDVPQVTMLQRDFSLDLPQVTMRENRIIWDNPETYMETTVCGWYPEFRGFKITMKEILCDLPQVRMVRREAILDVPEFTWSTTGFSLDIPEFKMDTQEFSLDLPQCTLRDVKGEIAEIQESSESLQSRAETLARNQQAELNLVISEDLIVKRQEASNAFDEALTGIDAAIVEVQNYGIDPTSVVQADGSRLNLYAKREEIQVAKDSELAKLDEQIKSVTTLM